ncbi:hypothetical protein Cpir12675_001915 [Ceratocystis pirilliformis]|uniref:F-box domain-containing protein n=1 Tax=Ceratocystis pirilliformis TaxID=259994 RepID=A0ABR3ZDC3_9PEZI
MTFDQRRTLRFAANDLWHKRPREHHPELGPEANPNNPVTGLPSGFDELPGHLKSDISRAQVRANQAREQFRFPAAIPLVLDDPLPSLGPLRCGVDILEALIHYYPIMMNILSYLRPKDILTLYSVSKPVKSFIDMRPVSTMNFLLQSFSPNGKRYFPYENYSDLIHPDPLGGTLANYESHATQDLPGSQVRMVPKLKWFQMVGAREVYITQILAFLARSGHRLPKGTPATLMKLWQFNEAPTNSERRELITNRQLWTPEDILYTQVFLVKLSLVFQDPIYGPDTSEFIRFLMGQRGLYDVWAALFRRKYTSLEEIMVARTRYSYAVPHEDVTVHFDPRTWGVPFGEIGRGHLEGWGQGSNHLLRIDQLLAEQSASYGMALQEHLVNMAIWGTFSWNTGRNVVPDEAEIDMITARPEEEEELLQNVNTANMFTRHHALKKRWHTLSYAEREAVRLVDRLEEAEGVKSARILQVARGDLEEPFLELYWTNVENYDIEWQMRRGWPLRSMTRAEIAHKATELWEYEQQPNVHHRLELDMAALTVESDISAPTLTAEEDEYLKSMADWDYSNFELNFDWSAFMTRIVEDKVSRENGGTPRYLDPREFYDGESGEDYDDDDDEGYDDGEDDEDYEDDEEDDEDDEEYGDNVEHPQYLQASSVSWQAEEALQDYLE